jgi:hypothetical protein
MSEEKKPFTVTDKRHFTREGEVREEEASPAGAAEPTVPEGPDPPSGGGVSRVVTGSAPAPDPAHARAEASYRQASEGRDHDHGGLDFVGLLLSLGTQASMMLGGARGPGEKPGPPDLEGARSIISLLEVLADKTQGRRTAEEDEVLDGLLYELRMQYVALARKGGS